MMETGESNTYAIIRHGKKRLLHQTPWYEVPSKIEDKEAIMDSLADSTVLWRQRIAMVSTWKTTQQIIT